MRLEELPFGISQVASLIQGPVSRTRLPRSWVSPRNIGSCGLPNGQFAFDNYVNHVQWDFSSNGIHSGPDGRKHRKKSEPYHVTSHGLALARSEFGKAAKEFQELPALAPTDDPVLLEARVRAARSRMISEPGGLLPAPPLGSPGGQQVSGATTRFIRDPNVIAWVLLRADGICEVCNNSAPFQRADGDPLLEVHHIRPLADGGPDTVDNTIANCPNCHRELHYGTGREALRAKVIAKTVRLIDHPVKPLGVHLPEIG